MCHVQVDCTTYERLSAAAGQPLTPAPPTISIKALEAAQKLADPSQQQQGPFNGQSPVLALAAQPSSLNISNAASASASSSTGSTQGSTQGRRRRAAAVAGLFLGGRPHRAGHRSQMLHPTFAAVPKYMLLPGRMADIGSNNNRGSSRVSGDGVMNSVGGQVPYDLQKGSQGSSVAQRLGYISSNNRSSSAVGSAQMDASSALQPVSLLHYYERVERGLVWGLEEYLGLATWSSQDDGFVWGSGGGARPSVNVSSGSLATNKRRGASVQGTSQESKRSANLVGRSAGNDGRTRGAEGSRVDASANPWMLWVLHQLVSGEVFSTTIPAHLQHRHAHMHQPVPMDGSAHPSLHGDHPQVLMDGSSSHMVPARAIPSAAASLGDYTYSSGSASSGSYPGSNGGLLCSRDGSEGSAGDVYGYQYSDGMWEPAASSFLDSETLSTSEGPAASERKMNEQYTGMSNKGTAFEMILPSRESMATNASGNNKKLQEVKCADSESLLSGGCQSGLSVKVNTGRSGPAMGNMGSDILATGDTDMQDAAFYSKSTHGNNNRAAQPTQSSMGGKFSRSTNGGEAHGNTRRQLQEGEESDDFEPDLYLAFGSPSEVPISSCPNATAFGKPGIR